VKSSAASTRAIILYELSSGGLQLTHYAMRPSALAIRVRLEIVHHLLGETKPVDVSKGNLSYETAVFKYADFLLKLDMIIKIIYKGVIVRIVKGLASVKQYELTAENMN
jgi:hypothetical protein